MAGQHVRVLRPILAHSDGARRCVTRKHGRTVRFLSSGEARPTMATASSNRNSDDDSKQQPRRRWRACMPNRHGNHFRQPPRSTTQNRSNSPTFRSIIFLFYILPPVLYLSSLSLPLRDLSLPLACLHRKPLPVDGDDRGLGPVAIGQQLVPDGHARPVRVPGNVT